MTAKKLYKEFWNTKVEEEKNVSHCHHDLIFENLKIIMIRDKDMALETKMAKLKKVQLALRAIARRRHQINLEEEEIMSSLEEGAVLVSHCHQSRFVDPAAIQDSSPHNEIHHPALHKNRNY